MVPDAVEIRPLPATIFTESPDIVNILPDEDIDEAYNILKKAMGNPSNVTSVDQKLTAIKDFMRSNKSEFEAKVNGKTVQEIAGGPSPSGGMPRQRRNTRRSDSRKRRGTRKQRGGEVGFIAGLVIGATVMYLATALMKKLEPYQRAWTMLARIKKEQDAYEPAP